jgi:hypothetical protein
VFSVDIATLTTTIEAVGERGGEEQAKLEIRENYTKGIHEE